jgi:hypothetical protein
MQEKEKSFPEYPPGPVQLALDDGLNIFQRLSIE